MVKKEGFYSSPELIHSKTLREIDIYDGKIVALFVYSFHFPVYISLR